MDTVLVARDLGPSLALNQIANGLGGVQECFFGNGKELSRPVSEIFEEAKRTGVILCGMSSSPDLAKEELAACETAVKNGVPLALFADTFRAWGRPWFEPYREAASALFVVSPAEAEKARELFLSQVYSRGGATETGDYR